MTDDASDDPQAEARIFWQSVPTVFADGSLGTANAGGLHRIVLGEMVFDPSPGATAPAFRPTCNLVMQEHALRLLIQHLQAHLDKDRDDGNPA